MSNALEVISKTGTATWNQLRKELGLSAARLGPVLAELLEAGHIEEEPKFTYHVAGRRPEGESQLRTGRQVRTPEIINGLCPFRGGNMIKVDDRCPETLTCEMSFGKTSERADVLTPTPILKQGTYCRKCIDGGTREKELGKVARRR